MTLSLRGTTLGCALALLLAAPARVAAQGATPPVPQPAGNPKSVAAARLIGVIPGAGHMYAGESERGVVVIGGLGAILVLGAMIFSPDCVDEASDISDPGRDRCSWRDAINPVTRVGLLGFWAWSIGDAGSAARRWNVRHGHAVSATVTPAITRTGASEHRLGARVGLQVKIR